LVYKIVFFGVGAATSPSKNTVDSDFLLSINLFEGLQYDPFKFGYSYDFNTTDIGDTGGVYELSLMNILTPKNVIAALIIIDFVFNTNCCIFKRVYFIV
jgi:hypothetical protein